MKLPRQPGIPAWLSFSDHGVSKESVCYPLGRFLDAWRSCLVSCKRQTVLWAVPLMPGGTRELQRVMADLLLHEHLPLGPWCSSHVLLGARESRHQQRHSHQRPVGVPHGLRHATVCARWQGRSRFCVLPFTQF